MRYFIAVLTFLCCSIYANAQNDADYLHSMNESLSDAIIFDGFSPPVASRIYAYCDLAAYESIRLHDDAHPSITNKLNAFGKIDDATYDKAIDNRIVMIECFAEVSKDLVYRYFFVDSMKVKLEAKLKPAINAKVYDNSLKAAAKLHALFKERMTHDHYARTRNMPKFTPSEDPGAWKPTYPTFSDALEPYWQTIIPFALDSASQFKSDKQPFSTDTGSALYKDAMNMYVTTKKLTKGEIDFADFWDCNPLKTNIKGHLMYKTRQLTPAGHWLGITRFACLESNTDLITSAYAYAMVSTAMADAFINCWSEKMRNNSIRPITYIQRYIDKQWVPILETPSFPEHPSGHSEVSAAAATVLTKCFGNNLAFTDSTEMAFKRLPRSYKSFQEAADEAAMSRYYGGIHFMLACEDSKTLGRSVAEVLLRKTSGK
jgi:hypothetical protein